MEAEESLAGTEACRNQRHMRVAILIAGLLISFATQAAEKPKLEAEGTQFKLTLSNGRVLHSKDLLGATLTLPKDNEELRVRIVSIAADTQANNGTLLLHQFDIVAADGSTTSFCPPDAAGDMRGFPLPKAGGGYSIACLSGADGKCVRLGYRPFDEVPDGPPLARLFAACLRVITADYGGNGAAHTVAGRRIAIADRFGIRKIAPEITLPFEAAWNERGATCIAHPRLATTELALIAARYPHLNGHLGQDQCREDAALADPAVLLITRSARE